MTRAEDAIQIEVAAFLDLLRLPCSRSGAILCGISIYQPGR